MADDLHYVGGDNYLLDDISGFKIRAKRARIIPGGQTGQLAVAPERWEPQQPQDFVTGVIDDQTAELVRSRQPNQFTVVGSNVATFAPRGALAFTVQSSQGFAPGSPLQIMLDSGENFFATLITIDGNTLGINLPLPASVGSGSLGDPLENLVIQLAPGGPLPSPPDVFILSVLGQDVLNTNVLA